MTNTEPSLFGENDLDERARRRLQNARTDPRIGRAPAAVADYWDAIDEAERTRRLSVYGLYELLECLPRYEREHQISREDPGLDPGSRFRMLQRWERGELAKAAIETSFASLNAQALVAMNAALDSMVDDLAPVMREILARGVAEQLGEKLAETGVSASSAVEEEIAGRGGLDGVINDLVGLLPKLDRLEGRGAGRYEARLRGAGLGTAPHRPIPDDLDEALAELGAIRDVLQHRSSRIDAKALDQAPSLALRYAEGELVRIDRDDYRRYSAAIRCYGSDVTMRPMRAVPGFEEHLPDLVRWPEYYVLGD